MGTEVALLEWVKTFTLTEDVKSLGELTDGHILWDILRDVDPTYFTSSLPEGRAKTTKWIPRYENLKHLHKALAAYISEECDQALYAPHAGEGLKAIAQHASFPEFCKLFQLVLQATIFSPRQQDYILKMISLTPASQQSLKELIEVREVAEGQSGQQDGPSDRSTTFVADPELEFEERFGKLMAENERLLQEKKDIQLNMRALDDRLVRLQDNNAVLQQKLTEAEDFVQMNGPAYNAAQSGSVEELESKIKQQENDFADQELRMAKQTRKTEALQRKIANLEASSNSSAKKAQEARDELDVVRRDRDALAKKANMVDKFKQQLQASNSLKKENDTMRSQLDDFRKDADAFAQFRQDHARLEIELGEFKKLVPRIEADNADLLRIKRQLEFDHETLRKQHKQDQVTIAQLNQSGSSVSSVESNDNNDIEDEFSELTHKQAAEKDRISNLEKQKKELQSIIQEKASEVLSLQRSLDEATDRSKEGGEVRRLSFSSSASPERQGSAQGFGVPTPNGIAQPAHNMTSLEDYQHMRKQLDNEKAKRKKVDTQLRDTIRELDIAKKDRESLLHRYMNAEEQHSNHLAVAYAVTDKLEMSAKIKADTAIELQSASPQNHSQVPQEIIDLVASIKADKPMENPSKAVDVMSDMIIQGKEKVAEIEKVHYEAVVPILEAEPAYRRPTIVSMLRSR